MPEAGNGLFRLPDQGEHFGARECGHRVVVGGLPLVLQQDEGIGESTTAVGNSRRLTGVQAPFATPW